MTDRGRYHLRGLVQSVRLQFGSTDPLTSDWAPLKDGPTLTFDREGREEGRQHSDAPMLSTVDERGLRTTVGSQAPFLPRQAAMEYGISVAAAVKFDVLTHYDPHDRPTEIVYRDPEQKALHRILLTYDDYGRIVREQVLMGDVFGGDEYSCVDSAAGNQRLTAEQREEVAAMFRAALPDGVFLTRDTRTTTRDDWRSSWRGWADCPRPVPRIRTTPTTTFSRSTPSRAIATETWMAKAP
jgi:hypothetical protein